MTGLLNPKSSENSPFFCQWFSLSNDAMDGVFHPRYHNSSFISHPKSLLVGELLSSQIEESQKIKCGATSIVAVGIPHTNKKKGFRWKMKLQPDPFESQMAWLSNENIRKKGLSCEIMG